MIFQEPMTSLNPVHTVGDADREAFRLPAVSPGAAATQAAKEALERVRIPDAAQRLALLPARALGRHAAARDDRHGDRGQRRAS